MWATQSPCKYEPTGNTSERITHLRHIHQVCYFNPIRAPLQHSVRQDSCLCEDLLQLQLHRDVGKKKEGVCPSFERLLPSRAISLASPLWKICIDGVKSLTNPIGALSHQVCVHQHGGAGYVVDIRQTDTHLHCDQRAFPSCSKTSLLRVLTSVWDSILRDQWNISPVQPL